MRCNTHKYLVFTSKRLPLQPVSSERNHILYSSQNVWKFTLINSFYKRTYYSNLYTTFYVQGKYKVSAEILDNATGKRIVCVKDVVGEIKL